MLGANIPRATQRVLTCGGGRGGIRLYLRRHALFKSGIIRAVVLPFFGAQSWELPILGATRTWDESHRRPTKFGILTAPTSCTHS